MFKYSLQLSLPKLNNCLSRRSISSPLIFICIVLDPTWVTFYLSQSYFFSPSGFNLGRVNCIWKITLANFNWSSEYIFSSFKWINYEWQHPFFKIYLYSFWGGFFRKENWVTILFYWKLTFLPHFPPQVETFIHIPNGHTPFDPLDMAIDPYSRLLYWTCDNHTAINVTRLDGTPVGLVISGKDQKPRLLALMPEKGYGITMYGFCLACVTSARP